MRKLLNYFKEKDANYFNLLKEAFTDIKKYGYAELRKNEDFEKNFKALLSKKYSSLVYKEVAPGILLLIHPKKFRERNLRVSIYLRTMNGSLFSSPPAGSVYLYVDNSDYLLVIIDFLKDYVQRITIDPYIDVPVDILNKMCRDGYITEEDKLLLLIQNPNIVFPGVKNEQ